MILSCVLQICSSLGQETSILLHCPDLGGVSSKTDEPEEQATEATVLLLPDGVFCFVFHHVL